jgi:hypothetical protein
LGVLWLFIGYKTEILRCEFSSSEILTDFFQTLVGSG